MSRAQWRWELLDDVGTVLDRPVSPMFATRFDAEAWLGEHWRELARQGVGSAHLQHGGRAMTVPVPLGPA